MKIIYLHQYFYFPDEYGTTRSYWIAKKLVEDGHEVVMVTSNQKKDGKFIEKKRIENIDLIYIRSPYDNKMNKSKRIISFLRFMIVSSWIALRIKNADLVYATSTPLTVAIPALLRQYILKTPFIFEVRDLWPEFPIQVGAISNQMVIKFLRLLERLTYNKSKRIIALSPGMRDGVLRTGIQPEKVSVVSNMSKPDIFYPRDKNRQLALKFGINLDKFNVIHFGAMGIANGLDYITKTARIAKDQNLIDFNFVFLGDGYFKESLVDFSHKNNLDNIVFIKQQNTNMTSEIVNLCDVSVVTFLNIPVTSTNSPNKLFDSLSAGKPVIVNSSGWTKDLVELYKCGYFVNPECPNDLVNKLQYLKANRDVYKEMALNARKLSLEKFNKEILTKNISEIIENLNTT